MKKITKLLLVLVLGLTVTACGSKDTAEDSQKLVVSASLDPHSKILEEAKIILKDDYNIDLEIKVLDDYFIFNKALDAGEVDANFFQHVPFFEGEVDEHGYDIVNVAGIHLEPFGFYSKTITDVKDLKDGATIVISNSVADHGRILAILEEAELITLKDGVDKQKATTKDIASNPKNLKFVEVKPELLITTFEAGEGDLVAINGNYAIQGGLNPLEDAVILEKATADNPYVNLVAAKKGTENDEKIKALVEVLKSEKIKKYINDTYKGAVIPAE